MGDFRWVDHPTRQLRTYGTAHRSSIKLIENHMAQRPKEGDPRELEEHREATGPGFTPRIAQPRETFSIQACWPADIQLPRPIMKGEST
jgi:hypothetical protein